MKLTLLYSCILYTVLTPILIYAQQPVLIGTTSAGGQYGKGVIFKINADGTNDSVIYHFTGTSGSYPIGKLIQANNNLFYGVTFYGGTQNKGVLFSFNHETRAYTKLVDFTGTNGSNPIQQVTQASNNKLYGTTLFGGVNDNGTIFCYDINSNTFTKLHDFDSINGRRPGSNLIQASDDRLYGTTQDGNPSSIIYSYDIQSQNFNTVYTLNDTDGQNASGTIFQDNDGYIYGTTINSGLLPGSSGSMFKFNPATGSFKSLYSLKLSTGIWPYSGLTKAGNGLIYGLTTDGATGGYGSLFVFDPLVDSSFAIASQLKSMNIRDAKNALTLASNGILYSTTYYTGSAGGGALFSYNPATGIVDTLFKFKSAATGLNPQSAVTEIGNQATSVTELNSNLTVNIYPNPTSDYLHINLMGLQAENATVYNMNGQLMLTAKQPAGNRINISTLPTGIYILEIAAGKRTCKTEWIKL